MVCLFHFHMVHLSGQPHVERCLPFVAINRFGDGEDVGLFALIFNIIQTDVGQSRKVDSCVVVAIVVNAPFFHFRLKNGRLAAVRFNLHNLCRRSHRVVLVELNHGNLLLIRRVANLRESDVGFAGPVRVERCLDVPFAHKSSLAGV